MNKSQNPILNFRRMRSLTQSQLGAMFPEPFTKATICRWEKYGVPVERVIEIEEVTGIPRAELCPAFFAVSAGKGAAA